jgi:hypothetical protein
MKRIGLLKVGFFVGVHWMEFADTTLGISEQYLFLPPNWVFIFFSIDSSEARKQYDE